MPSWGQDDLPEPLPFSPVNVVRTIGPGAILLAASIGGGEWLVGPAITVQFGAGVLWFATVAIVLQLLFNLEGIRYTLYSGEPILTGIMRLRPGSTFWASVYLLLAAAQLGIPALAAACAQVLFTAFADHLPGKVDDSMLNLITYAVMIVTVAILASGRTIERVLEYVSWAMIVYVFVFLFGVNLWFVPARHWGATLAGFLQFGHIPAGVDLLLLASLAATAGSGGIGNLVISNWVRDKGFGMGAKVGAIGSAFASQQTQVSHVGKVFPINGENLRRWRLWWKFVAVDQVWLWGLGCFVGMYLNVNLATAIIGEGTDLTGRGAGAYQAEYMMRELWVGFWFLALLNGFWILFSTHLGNTDTLVRTVTDILWVSSSRVRNWRTGAISRIYYVLLAIFTVWGMVAVRWGHAMDLFKVLGSIASPILALAAIQILRVNTTLLPQQLRPSLWRKAALVACALFYGTLSAALVWDLAPKAAALVGGWLPGGAG